jgi:hypothetical protein
MVYHKLLKNKKNKTCLYIHTDIHNQNSKEFHNLRYTVGSQVIS